MSDVGCFFLSLSQNALGGTSSDAAAADLKHSSLEEMQILAGVYGAGGHAGRRRRDEDEDDDDDEYRD